MRRYARIAAVVLPGLIGAAFAVEALVVPLVQEDMPATMSFLRPKLEPFVRALSSIGDNACLAR